MINGLYRCSVALTDWKQSTVKGTYYVVASSKEDAQQYLQSHLHEGGKITSVSFMGKRYGDRLYGRVHK